MYPKTIKKLDAVKALMAKGMSANIACKKVGLANCTYYTPEAKAYLASSSPSPTVETFDADDTPRPKNKYTPYKDKLNKSEVALSILQNTAIPAAARIDLAVSFLR